MKQRCVCGTQGNRCCVAYKADNRGYCRECDHSRECHKRRKLAAAMHEPKKITLARAPVAQAE